VPIGSARRGGDQIRPFVDAGPASRTRSGRSAVQRLFGASERTATLTLADCRALESGTVILTYRPARA
jgi:hypothetical protein